MPKQILAIIAVAVLTACDSHAVAPSYSAQIRLVQAALDSRGASRVCIEPATSQKGEAALAHLGLLREASETVIIPPHSINSIFDWYMSRPGRGYTLTDSGSDFAEGSVTDGVPASFCGASEVVMTVNSERIGTYNDSKRITYEYAFAKSAPWIDSVPVQKAYPNLAPAIGHELDFCEMTFNKANALIGDTCHPGIGGASY